MVVVWLSELCAYIPNSRRCSGGDRNQERWRKDLITYSIGACFTQDDDVRDALTGGEAGAGEDGLVEVRRGTRIPSSEFV